MKLSVQKVCDCTAYIFFLLESVLQTKLSTVKVITLAILKDSTVMEEKVDAASDLQFEEHITV